MNRAYAILHVKGIDAERRTITGLATTPNPDRMGDIVEPKGVKFKNPLPLLLFHDHRRPVGSVTFDKATDDGITFSASIPDIADAGPLRDRVEEAWQSIKAGLIKGVSIGFRVLDDGIELLRTGGVRFTKTEVLELSLVSVPANAEATIHSIKSYDAEALAASGGSRVLPSSGVPDVSRTTKGRHMKTLTEQIASFEATRQAKSARMTEIMQTAADGGVTLDAAQAEEYDGLEAEVKSVDAHLVRLYALDKANKAAAVTVSGATPAQAAASRGPAPVITVKDVLPPGIGYARALKCQMISRLDNRYVLDVAKEMYPNDQRLHGHFVKAAVPAGTTTEAVWASPLVDPTNLASEFVEFLRPMTILGKFGQGGIPSLRRVPFNIRFTGQTSGGTGYWVGQGAPKPLTSFGFEANTLGYTKVAAIAVITQELARFSTPSAEALVRDALAAALVERLDIDFVDPAQSAVANVNPASVTNGLTALTSAGTSADNARTDLTNLLSAFIEANINPTSLVLIMPNTLALALSIMVNSLGQPEFPGLTMNGGSLMGIPVIASQYAANASGGGNLVIAVNASDVFLADDGAVSVDASTEASLQMLDNPTNNSASATATTMVSMYQTNSIALRAERFINWAKRRDEAVVYMDDVNWGSVGSPA